MEFIQSVQQFVVSPKFQFLVIPFVAAVMALSFKVLTRSPDDVENITRDDLLIGFELGVGACIINLLSVVQRVELHTSVQSRLVEANGSGNTDIVEKLSTQSSTIVMNLGFNIMLFFVLILCLSLAANYVQKNGWEEVDGKHRLRIFKGLVVPGLAGALCLMIATGVAGVIV